MEPDENPEDSEETLRNPNVQSDSNVQSSSNVHSSSNVQSNTNVQSNSNTQSDPNVQSVPNVQSDSNGQSNSNVKSVSNVQSDPNVRSNSNVQSVSNVESDSSSVVVTPEREMNENNDNTELEAKNLGQTSGESLKQEPSAGTTLVDSEKQRDNVNAQLLFSAQETHLKSSVISKHPKLNTSSNRTVAEGKDTLERRHEALCIPLLTPGRARIGVIPSIGCTESPRYSFTGQRTAIPPKMVRMAAVSLTHSTTSLTSIGNAVGVEHRDKSNHGWEEAMKSRPPLRIDLEGPTPCTYSPRNKPLQETNAPAYSFGTKCQPVKNGGGRTAWWKTWFQTPHVWLNKVDFVRDQSWPTPSLYSKRVSIGAPNPVASKPTNATNGGKNKSTLTLPGVSSSPSPNCYNRQAADNQVLKRSSSFTHGFRRGGTVLWSSGEITPGPGHYENNRVVFPSNPSFTIQGIRREKSFELGPFSTF